MTPPLNALMPPVSDGPVCKSSSQPYAMNEEKKVMQKVLGTGTLIELLANSFLFQVG